MFFERRSFDLHKKAKGKRRERERERREDNGGDECTSTAAAIQGFSLWQGVRTAEKKEGRVASGLQDKERTCPSYEAVQIQQQPEPEPEPAATKARRR